MSGEVKVWQEKKKMVTGYGHSEYLTRNQYVERSPHRYCMDMMIPDEALSESFKDKLKREAGERWDKAESG